MSEVKDNSWLDKIKDLLGDSPKDKKDLISLLSSAASDNLISQDSMTLLITAFNSSLTSIAMTWGLGIIISLTGISETLNTPRIIWYES